MFDRFDAEIQKINADIQRLSEKIRQADNQAKSVDSELRQIIDEQNRLGEQARKLRTKQESHKMAVAPLKNRQRELRQEQELWLRRKNLVAPLQRLGLDSDTLLVADELEITDIERELGQMHKAEEEVKRKRQELGVYISQLPRKRVEERTRKLEAERSQLKEEIGRLDGQLKLVREQYEDSGDQEQNLLMSRQESEQRLDKVEQELKGLAAMSREGFGGHAV